MISHNVRINGRRTSIRLEPAMWDALQEICAAEKKSIHEISTEVAAEIPSGGFTSALRVYILNYFRPVNAATQTTFPRGNRNNDKSDAATTKRQRSRVA